MGEVSGQEITTDQPSSGQVKTLVMDVKDTSVEARDNVQDVDGELRVGGGREHRR
jgi:hypothetical protein